MQGLNQSIFRIQKRKFENNACKADLHRIVLSHRAMVTRSTKGIKIMNNWQSEIRLIIFIIIAIQATILIWRH